MKKIRVLYIFNVLFFILFCFELCNTYSVFESNASGEVSSKLASWKVLVNDTDIVKSNTFTIDNINFDTSTRVVTGKAAPGISGRFDIVIVPDDTEVSFRYDITFDFSSLDNQEFSVISIEDINGGNLVRTGEFTYSGVYSLDNINDGYISDIKVSLLWNNNEENNDKDYELGSKFNNSLSIPVSVHIIQYQDEGLEEYVEN